MRVTAGGGFEGHPCRSTGVHYSVELEGDAPETVLRDLLGQVEDVADRLDAAAAGYRATGRRIAEAFPATEKMSSRQRLGMVDDMWEKAIHRLVGGPPPQRESCCLMYALPGLTECTGCPRSPRAL